MKITLQVFWEQYDWQDKGRFIIAAGNESLRKIYGDLLYIREIEVDIPGIEEPSREQIAGSKVAALKIERIERQEVMAESQMKLNSIDDKIKQLSCIEYKDQS